MSRRDEPLTKVWMRGNESAYVLRAEDYDAVLRAWTVAMETGSAGVFHGHDPYGDPIHLRLSEVVALGLNTAEGNAAWEADEAEARITGDYE